MKRLGNLIGRWCGLLIIAVAGPSFAELSASVDREQVSLGDTLTLSITATGAEDLNAIDIAPLQQDFHIVQRKSSSNTSVINGQTTSIRQLILDLKPRGEGNLRIPPLSDGNVSSELIQVSVGPAPTVADANTSVIFEAEVDRATVYVQGQVLLTLRIQQAVNLESRNVTELKLDNAFVKPLEQKSFQRTVAGRPWLVHELRYAIFPEQSGLLEIPSQTFNARETDPRRSLFNRNAGRQISRATEPLAIEVLPRPDSFPGSTWLPAQALTIEEQWSTPPDQLTAGESTTRSIRISGQGLLGAQLPPVLFPPTEGLKYYPDQPQIEEQEVRSGLLGTRQDSAALVPVRAGSWQLPELRIPWWDTEAGELRYAVLPGRTIEVAAAPAPSVPTTAAPAVAAPSPTPITVVPAASYPGLWQWLTAISTLGWLLTLVYVVRLRRSPRLPAEPDSVQQLSERRAFDKFQTACLGGSASGARQALLDWAALRFPQTPPTAISTLAARLNDPQFSREADGLTQHLYSAESSGWDGAELAAATRRLRRQLNKAPVVAEPTLQLYPGTETTSDLVTTS